MIKNKRREGRAGGLRRNRSAPGGAIWLVEGGKKTEVRERLRIEGDKSGRCRLKVDPVKNISGLTAQAHEIPEYQRKNRHQIS